MRALLVSLALVSAAIAGVSAGRNLYKYCMDLEYAMPSDEEAYKDPEVILGEAKKYLKSIANLGKPSRAKLATAWEVVVRAEPCNSHSAEYVSIIADCNPSWRDKLFTLYEAVRKYSARCLTPDFWDEKLKKTLGSGDRTGLLSFMNEDFLKRYRLDNNDERELHFATIGGPNCCKPHRSRNALARALAPIVGLKEDETLDDLVKKDLEKLELALQKNLFKPCESYVKLVDSLMNQAADAGSYDARGKQAFVDSQSATFKDAIFRYKYCSAFAYKRGSREKLEKIWPKLVLQQANRN